MSKASKPKKPRAKKCEEKVAEDGTFAEVFKVIKRNKEDKSKGSEKR